MSLGSPGRLALLAGGTLLFADLFLAWQRRCISVGATEQVCADRAGWYGFGIAVGLATTLLVVWVAAQLARVELPPRVDSALALGVLVLVAIEFATHGSRRQWPAWVGLGLSILIAAAGAWTLLDSRNDRR
jgi:hypothetical protein